MDRLVVVRRLIWYGLVAGWVLTAHARPAGAQIVHYPPFTDPAIQATDTALIVDAAGVQLLEGACLAVSGGYLRAYAADGSSLGQVELKDETIREFGDRVRGQFKGITLRSSIAELGTHYIRPRAGCTPATRRLELEPRTNGVRVVTTGAVATALDALGDTGGSTLLRSAGIKTDLVVSHRPVSRLYASFRIGFRTSDERQESDLENGVQVGGGTPSTQVLLEAAEQVELATRLDLVASRVGELRFDFSVDAGVSYAAGPRVIVLDSIIAPSFGLTVNGTTYPPYSALDARFVFGDREVDRVQADLDINRGRFSVLAGPTVLLGDDRLGGYLSTGFGGTSVPKSRFDALCLETRPCADGASVLDTRSLAAERWTEWRGRYRIAGGIFASGLLLAGEAVGPLGNSGQSTARFMVAKEFVLQR